MPVPTVQVPGDSSERIGTLASLVPANAGSFLRRLFELFAIPFLDDLPFFGSHLISPETRSPEVEIAGVAGNQIGSAQAFGQEFAGLNRLVEIDSGVWRMDPRRPALRSPPAGSEFHSSILGRRRITGNQRAIGRQVDDPDGNADVIALYDGGQQHLCAS